MLAPRLMTVALAVLRQASMATFGDKSVLVIDDDVGMLRALTKVLNSEGCMVASAPNAEAAVKLLGNGQQCFDLIITDLRMSVIDGMSLLHGIKQVYPEVPVIIITAFGSPKAKTEASRLGASAFLEKPVDTRRLLATVDRVLAPAASRPNPFPHSEFNQRQVNHADGRGRR